MQDSFLIDYEGSRILIEHQKKIQNKNLLFTAHLPKENITIECIKYNDGALRWFDRDVNHETEISKAIGEALDIYIMKNKEVL
jgi:hypothetical protein